MLTKNIGKVGVCVLCDNLELIGEVVSVIKTSTILLSMVSKICTIQQQLCVKCAQFNGSSV